MSRHRRLVFYSLRICASLAVFSVAVVALVMLTPMKAHAMMGLNLFRAPLDCRKSLIAVSRAELNTSGCPFCGEVAAIFGQAPPAFSNDQGVVITQCLVCQHYVMRTEHAGEIVRMKIPTSFLGGQLEAESSPLVTIRFQTVEHPVGQFHHVLNPWDAEPPQIPVKVQEVGERFKNVLWIRVQPQHAYYLQAFFPVFRSVVSISRKDPGVGFVGLFYDETMTEDIRDLSAMISKQGHLSFPDLDKIRAKFQRDTR